MEMQSTQSSQSTSRDALRGATYLRRNQGRKTTAGDETHYVTLLVNFIEDQVKDEGAGGNSPGREETPLSKVVSGELDAKPDLLCKLANMRIVTDV